MPHPALPLLFHQKPNISETIQIPTPKPYILFFVAPACSRVRYRRLLFRQSVRQSVRPSVNIYVEVRHLCQS